MWKEYHQGDPIEMVSSDMQTIVLSLFNSLMNVKEDFIYWTINNEKIKDDNHIYVERAFAYELYFQWKMNTTIGDTPIYKMEDKYIINAEIKKEFMEKVSEKSNYGYPDMVLHGGNDTNHNYIVCEIKRKETVENNKDSLTKDINKLGFFLRDDLHTIYKGVDWNEYKYGFFIMTGKDWGGGEADLKPSDFSNNLKLDKLDVKEDYYSRIICVLYNGKSLRYNLLKNVIEEKNKK